MRNLGQVGPPEAGVRVVGTTAGEGVVGSGEQLQHELVGAQAHAEQHGFVAVVGVDEVGGGELETGGKLDGLVPA